MPPVFKRFFIKFLEKLFRESSRLTLYWSAFQATGPRCKILLALVISRQKGARISEVNTD